MSLDLAIMLKRASRLATLAVIFSCHVTNCQDTQVEIDAQGNTILKLDKACEGTYYDENKLELSIAGTTLDVDGAEYSLVVINATDFSYTDDRENDWNGKCDLEEEKLYFEDASGEREIWSKPTTTTTTTTTTTLGPKEFKGTYLKGEFEDGNCVVKDPKHAAMITIDTTNDLLRRVKPADENLGLAESMEEYRILKADNLASVLHFTSSDEDEDEEEREEIEIKLNGYDTLSLTEAGEEVCYFRKQDRVVKTVTFEAGLDTLGFSIDKETRKRDTVDYVNISGKAAALGVMTGWKILQINDDHFRPGGKNTPLNKLEDLVDTKKKTGFFEQIDITFDATQGELGRNDFESFERCIKKFETLEHQESEAEGAFDSQDYQLTFDDFKVLASVREPGLNRIKDYGAAEIRRLSDCKNLDQCVAIQDDATLQTQVASFRAIIDATLLTQPDDDLYFGVHDVCKLIVACVRRTEKCKLAKK